MSKGQYYNEEIPIATAVIATGETWEDARDASRKHQNKHHDKKVPPQDPWQQSHLTANAVSGSKEPISSGGAKPWPPKLVEAVINSLSRHPDEEGVARFLTKYHWPRGLQQAVIKSLKKIPVRFYVVDDSGNEISGFIFITS
jgi:hypothetical protein